MARKLYGGRTLEGLGHRTMEHYNKDQEGLGNQETAGLGYYGSTGKCLESKKSQTEEIEELKRSMLGKYYIDKEMLRLYISTYKYPVTLEVIKKYLVDFCKWDEVDIENYSKEIEDVLKTFQEEEKRKLEVSKETDRLIKELEELLRRN